ncbi:hypothetical protein NBRC116601_33120 [Cognatishimia sp. WU-CL00825]
MFQFVCDNISLIALTQRYHSIQVPKPHVMSASISHALWLVDQGEIPMIEYKTAAASAATGVLLWHLDG